MAEGGNNISAALTEEHQSNTASNSMETPKTADSLDLFLERSRSERLNELQTIQNENRPVTGQNNRENIGQFVAKNMQVRDNVSQQHASGKENVPLNSPNVEEHRPEAVVVEIQGLSQQGRVSNVLQTAAFRRHLENIIRGSFNAVSQSHSTTPRQTPAQTSARSRQPTNAPPPPPPVPAPRPSLARDNLPQTAVNFAVSQEQERRDSVSSGSSSSAASTDYNLRIQDPRGLLRFLTEPQLAAPTPPPAPTQPAEVNSDAQPMTWNNVNELQHEDLIQEVSELVHRRLVTSTLEGEFRNVLEFHIRDRVAATGTEGQQVQNFVQSIRQTQPHIRNDFSNLGIPNPADNWDNVSVTSISATAVPYTQTNLYMSRELAALKSQLQEMKNMMKVSFDLQMDIQRSIRQEVAAGIAAATGGPVPKPEDSMANLTTPRAKPVSDTHCLICLDNHSDSVLYQCGHMCVCFPCGKHLMDRNAKCPVCRAPIRDIIRAYKCNVD